MKMWMETSWDDTKCRKILASLIVILAGIFRSVPDFYCSQNVRAILAVVYIYIYIYIYLYIYIHIYNNNNNNYYYYYFNL